VQMADSNGMLESAYRTISFCKDLEQISRKGKGDLFNLIIACISCESQNVIHRFSQMPGIREMVAGSWEGDI
jgi:hypothetical protein